MHERVNVSWQCAAAAAAEAAESVQLGPAAAGHGPGESQHASAGTHQAAAGTAGGGRSVLQLLILCQVQ